MVANALRFRPRTSIAIIVLAIVGAACSTTPTGFTSTTTAEVGATTTTGTEVDESDTAEGDPTTPKSAANQFNSEPRSGSLARISPPAIVVQVKDLRLTDQQGSLIALEATVIEVAYVDNTRPDIEAPSDTIMIWPSLNRLWGRGTDAATVVDSIVDPVVLILGFQGDTDTYDDLSNVSPYSLMGVVETRAQGSFVGPGTEQHSADLAVLSRSWQGTMAELLGELARELRIREAALSANTVVPALELIDVLVERPLTAVQAYEALAINDRDVEEAPQEIRDQLERRSVLVEIIGGGGLDNVAIGVHTDAGWTGPAISTLGGPSWVALLQPESNIRLFLFRFGVGDNEPVVIAEVPASLWDSSKGIYFAVPNDLVLAFASRAPVAPDKVSFAVLGSALLRSERVRVDALGDDTGGTIDEEPLPSELIGFESTD